MKAELMENRTSEIIELHNGIIGKLKQSVSEAIRIGIMGKSTLYDDLNFVQRFTRDSDHVSTVS